MAAWVASDLSTILPVVTAKIAEITGLDASRVVVSVLQPEDVPTVAAAQDVIVRLMGELPDEGIIHGSGRYDDRRHRTLEVSVRTRLHLDQIGQNLQQLTHASLGHLRMEDLVVEALELYSVAGTAGDVLTAPLRVGRLTTPGKLRSNPDWICSTFTVECEYSRDLDAAITTQFDE